LGHIYIYVYIDRYIYVICPDNIEVTTAVWVGHPPQVFSPSKF
jgi:hypothetical protein